MITLQGIDPKMIANNLTPSNPIHPGELIKDEIEYRGISQRKLALQMGVSPTLLNEILNGKRSVSTEYALLLKRRLVLMQKFGFVSKLGMTCKWQNPISLFWRDWPILEK